jgi:hypothetical protein
MRHARTLTGLAVTVTALALVSPLPASSAADPQPTRAAAPSVKTVLVVRSPTIDESSGLVRGQELFSTTNDSCDTGRVFTLGTGGRTVGVTRWSAHPSDCEALAPARKGSVWVGDIGDNRSTRASISISRIPVGRGDRRVHVPAYRLVYPGGPVNAETLMRNPTTHRLYIASKVPGGGRLYAVPRHLSRTGLNALVAKGPVLDHSTDGAFFPNGRHLVIRNYSLAEIYAWPSLKVVGSFSLPPQPQGEGIVASRRGVLYLSSEGVRQPILKVTLPRRLRTIVTGS